jgi:triacylglycerol lipase
VLSRLAAVLAALAVVPATAEAQSPPGANDYGCKPSTAKPYPVVLVHGTYLDMTSWIRLSPALAEAGYCVFALNYGNNATGDIPTSAGQLRTFVDDVLARTGASKVSIVGHSQGGMMPRYVIKFLDRANQVDELIGLSPSNHGTTNPLAGPAGQLGCPACAQQVAGSEFITNLNSGDETPPPIDYTVVQTRNDEVVTPYDSAFLPEGPRVTNVLLQDRCPADATDHIAIVGDPVAIQWVQNALGRDGPADAAFEPDCTGLAGEGGGSPPPAHGVDPGKLKIGAVSRRGRRVRVTVRVKGNSVERVVVRLKRKGRRLARSKPVSIDRRRVVKLKARLRAGRRYRLVARGTSYGHEVAAQRRYRAR